MKAVLLDRQGAFDGLRYADFPEPKPAPHECLVRTHAIALNGFDPMIVLGATQLKTPLPMVPAGDAAGEIVALGDDVDRSKYKIGDRVSLYPYVSGVGMMGETALGVCRDYFSAPAANLLPIPDGVSYAEAAALPVAYGTAYRMITQRAELKAGEKVLIVGATGGVGTCCIQLAKNCGAEVIAVGSSEWKLERLKALGADHVIDTSHQDMVAQAHHIAGRPHFVRGGGVDVVVNYVGGATWREALRTVRPRGRVVTCGASAGYDPPTDLRYIWTFELQILGSNGWTPQDQRAVLDLVSEGRIKPAIHEIRPLSRTADAIRELHERKVVGKSILVPDALF